jgi:hypothetical protein
MIASTSGKVRLLNRWNGSRMIRTPHAGVDASDSCVQTFPVIGTRFSRGLGSTSVAGPSRQIARLDRVVVWEESC